jgi:hypothetical protein
MSSLHTCEKVEIRVRILNMDSVNRHAYLRVLLDIVADVNETHLGPTDVRTSTLRLWKEGYAHNPAEVVINGLQDEVASYYSQLRSRRAHMSGLSDEVTMGGIQQLLTELCRSNGGQ